MNWWCNLEVGISPNINYYKNFRMSKSSFDALCERLGPHIARQTTPFRAPISVERRVGMTLYYLASEGGGQRITANQFGVGISTV